MRVFYDRTSISCKYTLYCAMQHTVWIIIEFTLVLAQARIQNHIPRPVSVTQLQILGLCNLGDRQ